MDDLVVFPIFLETPTSIFQTYAMFIRYFLATWCFPHAFEVILWSGVLPYGRFFERVGREFGYWTFPVACCSYRLAKQKKWLAKIITAMNIYPVKVCSLKETLRKHRRNMSVPDLFPKLSNSEMMRKSNKKHRRPTLPWKQTTGNGWNTLKITLECKEKSSY